MREACMSSPALLPVADNFSRGEGAGTDPVPPYSPMELKPIPVCPHHRANKG